MSEPEIMPIRQYGDEILTRKAKSVRRINAATRELLERMAATMYEAKGIGLAAPQVGVSERVIVADVGEGLIELINPEVMHEQGEATRMEGCLSIPNLLGEVTRPDEVRVRARDRRGRRIWLDADGLLARVIQHEIDHLNGLLFLDRASRVVEIPPEQRNDILFMGTPEFGAAVLEALLEAGCPIRAVVTQPDRPVGRSQELRASPVKALAEEHELPVLQPPEVGDAAFIAQVAGLRPDLVIACAYGQILPGALLAEARTAAVNVHASLLPKYRGAAPIQWAIIHGEEETGITTFYMDEGMDTGPILLQEAIPIGPDETAGQLHDRLAELAGEVLLETLRLIGLEQAEARPQDAAAATYAPRITQELARIAWTEPARALARRVRALNPAPGAHTFWHGRRLKIWRARVEPETAATAGAEPGTVVAVERDEEGGTVVVACGEELLALTELQPAGAAPMTAVDFANGYRVEPGQQLGGAADDADA